MFLTYKFINENIDSFIFIIFVIINLSNIIYYFYFKNNKKKKVKFNEYNLIRNNLILNFIRSHITNEINIESPQIIESTSCYITKCLNNYIVEQPHIIYDIKHIDSDDDFYGHFYDIDNINK